MIRVQPQAFSHPIPKLGSASVTYIMEQLVKATNRLSGSELTSNLRLDNLEETVGLVTSEIMFTLGELVQVIQSMQVVAQLPQDKLNKLNSVFKKTREHQIANRAEFEEKLESQQSYFTKWNVALSTVTLLCLLLWVFKWAHSACYQTTVSFRSLSDAISPVCCRTGDSRH